MYTLTRRYAARWSRRLLFLALLLIVFGLAWRLGQAARAARVPQPEPLGLVV